MLHIKRSVRCIPEIPLLGVVCNFLIWLITRYLLIQQQQQQTKQEKKSLL